MLVSHELEQLRELCTRGVWLREGRVVLDAGIDEVLAAYRLEHPPEESA
jgi:ABC-type polysaccharide/polyol phosphate transport system ATPase subunit